MILILLAAINLNLDLSFLHRGSAAAPASVTCHISTVSYRFVGEPGTEFRYEGDSWKVPVSGSIELIAGRNTTEFQVAGRSLPLQVWPRDEFGTRTIPLPRKN